MRVVHVAFSDNVGGSAKTTYRIHRALSNHGVDSLLVVRIKQTEDPFVLPMNSIFSDIQAKIRTKIDFELCRQSLRLKGLPMKESSANLIPSFVSTKLNRLRPDAVIVHWVGAGTVSFADMSKVEAPTVWRLTDEWLYSATTHYGQSPDISQTALLRGEGSGALAGIETYLDEVVFSQKLRHRELFRDVIAPSTWLAQRAHTSLVLSKARLHILPNPTDTSMFFPRQYPLASGLHSELGNQTPQRMRTLANAKHRSLRLVFISASDVWDRRKGLKDALDALRATNVLGEMVNLEVIGRVSRPSVPQGLEKSVCFLGALPPAGVAERLREADALIAPSTHEGLPQSGLEALASGIPIIAYADSAFADIIDQGVTGYLAKMGDSTGLLNGILWLKEINRDSISEMCRNKALRLFAPEAVAAKYIDLVRTLT